MSTATLHSENKKALVPQLRFPEFEKEWELKKFGSLGEFKGGGTPSTTNVNHWSGDIPWISSSDIYDGNLNEINIHRYLNKVAIEESATKIIPANSILLVSRVGVGKLAINKIELCTSQDFCNFIPNKCNSYFIGYFLIARKKILVNFSQGTSIKGFTTGDIKTLPIMLPALPEQQKIASFLSAIDEKTQQLSRKKELLELYKKGVMQQLFSGKLRFKDENGNDYPDWKEKKLGEVADVSKLAGYEFTKHIIYEDEGEIIALRGLNIKNNKLYLKDVKYIDNSELSKLSRSKLYINDLMFTYVGTIGEVALIEENDKYYLAPNVSRIRVNTKFVLPQYVLQYFNLSKFRNNEIEKFISSSSQPALSMENIRKFKIPIPVSEEEQQKIANFLSGIDAKIENVGQEINKMQGFKKGLLQQMFV